MRISKQIRQTEQKLVYCCTFNSSPQSTVTLFKMMKTASMIPATFLFVAALLAIQGSSHQVTAMDTSSASKSIGDLEHEKVYKDKIVRNVLMKPRKVAILTEEDEQQNSRVRSLNHATKSTKAPTKSTKAPSTAPFSEREVLNEDCEDTPFTFKVVRNSQNEYKGCDWVANKAKERCQIDGVSLMCAKTCDKCFRYKESTLKFEFYDRKNEMMRRETCDFIAEKKAKRCKIPGMRDTCRVTCDSTLPPYVKVTNTSCNKKTYKEGGDYADPFPYCTDNLEIVESLDCMEAYANRGECNWNTWSEMYNTCKLWRNGIDSWLLPLVKVAQLCKPVPEFTKMIRMPLYEHFSVCYDACDFGTPFDVAWEMCQNDGDKCMGVQWNSCENHDRRLSALTTLNGKGKWKLLKKGLDIGGATTPTEDCGGSEESQGKWDVFVKKSAFFEKPEKPIHIPNTYCEYYKYGGDGNCKAGIPFDKVWQKCLNGGNKCMGVMWNPCGNTETSDTSVNGAWKLVTAGQTIGDAENPTSTCGGKDQALGHWDIFVRPSMYNECGPSNLKVEISLKLDNYPSETSWTVTGHGPPYNGNAVTSGGPYGNYADYETVEIDDLCLNLSSCYTFSLFDSWGDGIYSSGDYEVKVNGEVILSHPGYNEDFSVKSIDFGNCD